MWKCGEHSLLAVALARAVHAKRRRGRSLGIGRGRRAIENEVGRHVNERGSPIRRCPAREILRARRVDVHRKLLLRLGFVHRGIRRCVDDQARRVRI